MAPPRATPPGGGSAASPPIELRIALQDVKPEIWRTVVVDPTLSLGELHHVIQVAMGWTSSHLYAFRVGDRVYTDRAYEMEDAGDAYEVPVAKLLATKDAAVLYEYDFGDGWTHKVKSLGRSSLDLGGRTAVCTGGAQACPPEDVGGVHGYADFLAILADPGHEEHEFRVQWLESLRNEVADLDPRFEGPFRADEFDVRLANFMLRQLDYEDEDDEGWDDEEFEDDGGTEGDEDREP